MPAFNAVPGQGRHACRSCSKTFDSVKGLVAHSNQIHALKEPVKWIQTDSEGRTKTFVVHAKKSSDATKGAKYVCPCDQHASLSSANGFMRHLKSCFEEFELEFDEEPRAQARPSGSGVLRRSETPLPRTPDPDSDYEVPGSDNGPLRKRRRKHSSIRGRSAKKLRIAESPDQEEATESTPVAAGSASAAGRTGPAQGPAAEVQGSGPGQQRTFLEDFLSRLSQQTGENFTRHADVFKEFGMLERHQFQRAQEKPALMDKISKKLEDRKVSVWAVSNIETFMDEYFAKDRGNDDHGVDAP